jgi:nitrite reductase (NADH) large subunit
MTNYLIVGNGAAGTTAAEEIRKHDKSGKIRILTEEDLPFYSRIRLPEFIAGEIEEGQLPIKKEAWYRDLGIELNLNTRIVKADRDSRTLKDSLDQRFSYDALLVATGSHSFLPPIKGLDKKGVFSLRNVGDARKIKARAETIDEVVLIGGGLLGLESGNALRKLGKKVTVVEFFPRLLPRQLDGTGAERLKALMEGMGFSFRLGAKTGEITGEGMVNGVLLEGGELLSCGMVIISAGVRPNMELAQLLSLDADKGIKVDRRMQTSLPGVYAAGDVAEFDGKPPYGIWPAATDQGKTAGASMAGKSTAYQGTTMSNNLKVVGVELASAGNIDAEGLLEKKTRVEENKYQKIVFDGGKIAGCIMLGNTSGFKQIVKAMAEQKDVSSVKQDILSDGFDFKKL